MLLRLDEWSLKGRKGVLLKLDLEKAYDKVDWSFLDMAMKLKGFGKRWRKWIWGCLSTTNFSIIVKVGLEERFLLKGAFVKVILLPLFFLQLWEML